MNYLFLSNKYDQAKFGLIRNLEKKQKQNQDNDNSINQKVGGRGRNEEKKKQNRPHTIFSHDRGLVFRKSMKNRRY